MFNFKNYTVIIYETNEDYYTEIPEHRFVAYLLEIPEASLHAYGSLQEEAILNLEKQFDAFLKDCISTNTPLPNPEKRDENEFSGKFVLRLPPSLHRSLSILAEKGGLSLNTYIVNNLIRVSTIEEVVEKLLNTGQVHYGKPLFTTSNLSFQRIEKSPLKEYMQEGNDYQLKKAI